MSARKPPSDDRLARAAELRAGGATWEVVALKLHRAIDTVRKWPAIYPERWQAALHAAERRLVSEAGAESVLVLRQLLRSDDDKVRRDAARFLIDLRLELAKLDHKATGDQHLPNTTSDTAQIVAFLEGQSDEQLEQLVAGLQAAAFPAPRQPLADAVTGAN